MKNIVLSIVALLAKLNVSAQISNLSFVNEQGLLTEIVNYPNNGIVTHTLANDYIIPSKVSLPFPFSFNGHLYDSLNISENGFVWFGSSDPLIQFDYSPISSVHNSNVRGIIAPLATNLEPGKHGDLPTTLKSGAVGNAPNRMFIIEWLNTSRYSTSMEGDTLSFQIKLYENTGEIEFVYGFFNLNTFHSTSVEVGLKGSMHTDFNNRSITNGIWNKTTRGSHPSDVCNLNSATKPTFGQLFRWYGTPVGRKEYEALEQMNVFPNPFSSHLTISASSANKTGSYQIYDLSGAFIEKGSFTIMPVDLSHLSRGCYQILINNGDQFFIKQLIKE